MALYRLGDEDRRQEARDYLQRSVILRALRKIMSDDQQQEQQLLRLQAPGAAALGDAVSCAKDVTARGVLTVSSGDDRLEQLTDNSTETYWSSAGADDKGAGKVKWIRWTAAKPEDDAGLVQEVCLHIDNGRDKNNAVKKVELLAGDDGDALARKDAVHLSKDFAGWVTLRCPPGGGERLTGGVVQVALTGGKDHLRVRAFRAMAPARPAEVGAALWVNQRCYLLT